MDLTLARRSGQALHNSYTITNSPALAPLRKFFCAAVRNLTSAYENRSYTQAEGGNTALDLRPNAPGHIPGFSRTHRLDRSGSGIRHSCGGVVVTYYHLIRHTTTGRGCSITLDHAKQPVLDLSPVRAI